MPAATRTRGQPAEATWPTLLDDVKEYNSGFWRADEYYLLYQGEGGEEVLKRIKRRLVARFGRVHPWDDVGIKMSPTPHIVFYAVFNHQYDGMQLLHEVDCRPLWLR